MYRQHFFNAPNPKSKKGRHTLAYTEWGNEHNPNTAICVHGLSRNARDFDFLAKELKKTHRVICPDIVGRGKSEWLENKKQYTYETYSNDIIALINHINNKPVDFIGTSMGGIIGMIIASNHPEYIKKLVLNDIGPSIPASALRRIVKYVTKDNTFNSKQEAQSALKTKLTTFGIKDPEHWEHMMHISIKELPNGKWQYTYDPAIIKKPPFWYLIKDINLWNMWHNITCPTYIIRGEKSDILTKETLNKMLETGPATEYIEHENIGHAPTLLPKEQIKPIITWLNKEDNHEKST